MSIIEEGNKVIEQRLLSDVEVEVDETLDFLNNHSEVISQFIPQLFIVSELHPTISVRKKAIKLLSQEDYLEQEGVQKTNLHFLRLFVEGEEESNEEILREAFKDYTITRKTIEPYLLSSPFYSRLYLEIANLLIEQKIDINIGQSLIQSFLKVYKNDEQANILLSRIFQYQEEYTKTIKLLKKVVKLNPNSFQGHLELGFVLEECMQNYKGAIKHFKFAAAINPDEIIVFVRLAYVYYFFLDKLKESRHYIDSVLNLDPSNQYALTILGRIYWVEQGKHTLALNTFLKGLDGSKFHHSFLLGTLAEFYIEALGNLDKGKAFYEQALDIEPENKVYLTQYMQLTKQFYNDYGNMKHYYEQYLLQHPTDIEVQMSFCLLIINYLNDVKLAKTHLKKVLALDSEHLIAKALYAEITD